MDISHGYFMVKFDLDVDRECVMEGGLWMLFDHFKQWMVFYDEIVPLTIVSTIGRPIKVDLNTLNMTRGRFARIYVEIDFHKLALGRFNLNNVWYNIEYKGVHLLCTICGCHGYVSRVCASPPIMMEKCA
uniref:DUF4283 domain-containing protein n=1 Tax=Cajanus cajan TaxID=3821 RepID=A0A151RUZ2_CAJCA|nr:hypothetical protein KK1_032011 [Cajanus cajan]